MKPRRNLISRLASLFRRKETASDLSNPAPASRRRVKESKIRGIEPLEGRIAPASLVDASTVTYKDVGGDLITIKFSKDLFSLTGSTSEQTITANNLDAIFKFSTGTFASDVEQDLQVIDLTKILSGGSSTDPASGLSFTITAAKPDEATGDDKVKIGAIEAAGIALGDIDIDGDLGQIDCGNSKVKIAIDSLNVDSLFKFGATTQPAATAAADALECRIVGGINLLHVRGDLHGLVQVVDGTSIVNNSIKTTAPANVKSILIDGSLRGNATVGAASNNTGTIKIGGNLGEITVFGMGDDANPGGLVGGGGDSSGSLVVSGTIDKVIVIDSLAGGAGANSGSILAAKTVKTVIIGDDLRGGGGKTSGSLSGPEFKSISIADSMRGGVGDLSGSIVSAGTVHSVQISQDIVGGVGITSGVIQAKTIKDVRVFDTIQGGAGQLSGSIIAVGNVEKVAITNDVIGGAGLNSGNIRGAMVKSVSIGGDLNGGTGIGGGVVFGNVINSVTVNGDILGGTAINSGGISADVTLKSAIVHGNVVGGAVFHTGFIESQSTIVNVQVDGELQGGDGNLSGAILSASDISKVVVNKLVGGMGDNSGSIIAGTDLLSPGTIKSVAIENGLVGGEGISSGSVLAGGTIGTVTIGSRTDPADLTGGLGDFSGSIIAQKAIGKSGAKPTGVVVFGSVTGGDGDQSGTIQSRGTLALVDIRGSLVGGDGELSGSVRAQDIFDGENFTVAGNLGIIKIAGNIVGGEGIKSGRVEAAGDLKSLSAVDLRGGIGTESGSVATGVGLVNLGDSGSIRFSGAITSTEGSVDPSVIVGGQLKALNADGGLNSAVVRVGQDLVKAIIGTGMTDSTISALGAEKVSTKKGDIAIGSLTVRGNVAGSQILAGYDVFGDAANADASISNVRVEGNWTASDLVAGVKDTDADGFGDADDASITGGTDRDGFIATIARVQITGSVSGTAGSGDQFGFVAEQISSFRHGSTQLGFTKAATGQTFTIAGNDDVRATEVTA